MTYRPTWATPCPSTRSKPSTSSLTGWADACLTQRGLHRFNLIYKRIPFETVWVAFADVESVSKEHGFAPTSTRPDGSPHYTLPAIRDQETGRAVTDSFAIAQYLDEKYPARPVIPSGTESLQTAFVDGLMATIGTVRRGRMLAEAYH
jgi:glutathione S-transferase